MNISVVPAKAGTHFQHGGFLLIREWRDFRGAVRRLPDRGPSRVVGFWSPTPGLFDPSTS